ncbi:MAG: hypothetical protein HAW66_04600 [Shewanella sp.]|nr:hypothetical protein [Shewanella sp.]
MSNYTLNIKINYEGSWRNSFLDENYKYIASITSMKKSADNYIEREITDDTAFGIMHRLIGDRRKIAAIRDSDCNYFEDLEIQFNDNIEVVNNEITYLRSFLKNKNKGSFNGSVNTDLPIFTCVQAQQFWGLLSLELDELCEFIIDESYQHSGVIDLDPQVIGYRLEDIAALKKVENNGLITQAIEVVSNAFPAHAEKYIEKDEKVFPNRLYAAALYLNLERLSSTHDMSAFLSRNGLITGLSRHGFNGYSDFMSNKTTGGAKTVFGNPYLYTEFVKGRGKVQHLLKKCSGVLEITIETDKSRVVELKSMILNASVSTFRMGKKGLSYVSDMKIKRVEI